MLQDAGIVAMVIVHRLLIEMLDYQDRCFALEFLGQTVFKYRRKMIHTRTIEVSNDRKRWKENQRDNERNANKLKCKK